jgi:hypothetical protein
MFKLMMMMMMTMSVVDGRCVREDINVKHNFEDTERGKAEVLREEPVPMSLCWPQTLIELACNRSRYSWLVSHVSLCRICGVTSDNTSGVLCIYLFICYFVLFEAN